MTEFNKTNWVNAKFVQQYRDNSDIYIVERRRMLEIMKSFYRHYLDNNEKNVVLDLGCGEGILTHELLSVDKSLRATLVDGSEDMLNRARDRLKEHADVMYIQVSFQELLRKNLLEREFDFIVSSLAIHHLSRDEKRDFFELIYSRLKENGYFLNIDVVLPPSETVDGWYMKMWQEWMDEEISLNGIEGNHFDDVIQRYKNNNDNKPDTLDDQLYALKQTGFRDVDCYYKYGVFSVYGGRK